MSVTILSVEDNPTTGAVIQKELVACGFAVELATSAEEAFAKLEEGRKYDLLILDFHLPGEQGPEFYRRIGMNPKYKGLPVIPFTSQFESSSPMSVQLNSEYSTAIQVDHEERKRQPIVSKGFSSQLEKLPASLYVAIAEVLRPKSDPLPPEFKRRMRDALATV